VADTYIIIDYIIISIGMISYMFQVLPSPHGHGIPSRFLWVWVVVGGGGVCSVFMVSPPVEWVGVGRGICCTGNM